jgi:hypothetical protein
VGNGRRDLIQGGVLDRADSLADLKVQDAKGEPVVLGTLWRDKPAVLAFVRHFG